MTNFEKLLHILYSDQRAPFAHPSLYNFSREKNCFPFHYNMYTLLALTTVLTDFKFFRFVLSHFEVVLELNYSISNHHDGYLDSCSWIWNWVQFGFGTAFVFCDIVYVSMNQHFRNTFHNLFAFRWISRQLLTLVPVLF